MFELLTDLIFLGRRTRRLHFPFIQILLRNSAENLNFLSNLFSTSFNFPADLSAEIYFNFSINKPVQKCSTKHKTAAELSTLKKKKKFSLVVQILFMIEHKLCNFKINCLEIFYNKKLKLMIWDFLKVSCKANWMEILSIANFHVSKNWKFFMEIFRISFFYHSFDGCREAWP